MKGLMVPAPLRERLPDAASEGLVDMFAEAHRLATESFERRLREATDSFERRLGEEVGKLRFEIADLRFEILKWSFSVLDRTSGRDRRDLQRTAGSIALTVTRSA